ncbi:unnamed protein product [Tuber aestivum]|uniref:Uncharacterized protein n=1 Tax=Tuber aestivum TaxID=59557 RepID=A0A292PR33_9PEZI|nr:unnamed protein product [Tuber aestivum]
MEILVNGREVSREPVSVALNLRFSSSWNWMDWEKLGIHADFTRPKLEEGVIVNIDNVRLYLEEGKESITCDPPLVGCLVIPPRITLGSTKRHILILILPRGMHGRTLVTRVQGTS